MDFIAIPNRDENVIVQKQKVYDMLSFGTLVFQICVITVNLKLCLHTRYWTVLFFLSIFISIIGFVFFSFLYCGIKWPLAIGGSETALYWVYMEMFTSISMVLATVVLIVIALLPDIIFIIFDNEQSHTLSHFNKHLNHKTETEFAQDLYETTPLRPERFRDSGNNIMSSKV